MENINSKNKLIAIVTIILCTLFTTAGQILWKYGVTNLSANAGILAYINLPIILGCVAYGIGAILMIIALKFWELSRIHPFLALGFVWISLFAPIFLGEILSTQRILGIGIIIIGVVFIGR